MSLNSDKREADPAEEYKRLLELRSGGRYVPPAKLHAVQEQIKARSSKSSKEYQRLQWDSLKKGINGQINKANVSNIQEVCISLFRLNLLRGRGIFARSIMKAQAISRSYTPIYAALVSVINSKLPEVGELLIIRLVLQFRRSFKRNDKSGAVASATFLAHLCNTKVGHEILALQILHLLLEQPTNDSVEIAVDFTRAVGQYLAEVSVAASAGVFDRLRSILHEGKLELRVQYMVETLFQVRKDAFKDNPAIPENLDLVEEEDQVTHMISLDDEDLDSQDLLNAFKLDEDYESSEAQYDQLRKEILGDDESDDENEQNTSSDADSDAGVSDQRPGDDQISKVDGSGSNEPRKQVIHDMTDTELITLRKTIYLTVMSTMSLEETCHKLLKIKVPPGNEHELTNMIVECCAQEKIYNKMYGGVAARLCRLRREWHDLWKETFRHYYEIIHRYDTNKLRNIALMFGYMLASDSLDWSVFECVHMTEEASTSSSRIFIKILLTEMRQELGLRRLVELFQDSYLHPYLQKMFPLTTAEETRFAINYYTAIELGALTDRMRDYLKSQPISSPQDYSSQSSSAEDERTDSEGLSDDELPGHLSSQAEIPPSSRHEYSSRYGRGRQSRSPRRQLPSRSPASDVSEDDFSRERKVSSPRYRRPSPPRRSLARSRTPPRFRRPDTLEIAEHHRRSRDHRTRPSQRSTSPEPRWSRRSPESSRSRDRRDDWIKDENPSEQYEEQSRIQTPPSHMKQRSLSPYSRRKMNSIPAVSSSSTTRVKEEDKDDVEQVKTESYSTATKSLSSRRPKAADFL